MPSTTLSVSVDKQLVKQMQSVIDKLIAGQARDFVQYKEMVARYKALQEARDILRDGVQLYMEDANG